MVYAMQRHVEIHSDFDFDMNSLVYNKDKK